MKNTVLTLRERLFSIIRRLGEEPERYARKPGRDFTRKQALTPAVLIRLILVMDEKSIWKGLLGHFRRRIDTPSASAFVQQRQKLLPSALEDLFHRFSDQLRPQNKTRLVLDTPAGDPPPPLLPLSGGSKSVLPFFFSCLSRQRRPIGGDVVLVQIAVAVGVLVEIQQLQPRLELAGKLLVRGVGELDAALVAFQLPHLVFVLKRVERECVDDPRLILVEGEVQPVVEPGQQPSAGL